MNMFPFRSERRRFPFLALPVLGSLFFLLKKDKTEEDYTIFIVGFVLYAYTFISMLLLYLMKEVSPYFLENFLLVCFSLNKVGITFGFMGLMASEMVGGTERWIRLLPSLGKIRRILMSESF